MLLFQALREKTNDERDQTKHDPASLGVNVSLPDPTSYFAAMTGAPLVSSSSAVVKTETKEITEECKQDEIGLFQNDEKVDVGNPETKMEMSEEKEEETTEIATV